MTKKPHPLTDKMIEDKLLNRLWWELETCQLEPCQDALREAYDKGFEAAIDFISRMGLAPHDALADAQEAFYNKEDNNDWPPTD